ncbi:hypothetical protein LEWO105114_02355 [Legionella worsleiensis]|nr:Uncharacterised protein [Legionella worsleiensis]
MKMLFSAKNTTETLYMLQYMPIMSCETVDATQH